jgi:hypothetical protein
MKCKSIAGTIRPIRGSIRRELVAMVQKEFSKIEKLKFGVVCKVYPPINDDIRFRLSEILFELQNKYEYDGKYKMVCQLTNDCRNRLYDDLRINECSKSLKYRV